MIALLRFCASRVSLLLAAALWISLATVSAGAAKTTSMTMHGEPRHAEGFPHFDYVNPHAPKGGRLRLAAQGSFDSLNPLIIRGTPAAGIREFLYESLLTRGLDEPFTLYAQLAEYVDLAPDRSSVTFYLNPKARFSDGKPVTADDLLFSWRVLRDHGRPNHRAYYRKVTKAERLSDLSVRFDLEADDLELPLILGLMPILPSHLLDEETFQRTTLTPQIGSGPYRIASVDPSRTIVYQRNPDWWGKDLPVNRGRFNFDEIRFDYFRDDAAMFEAFKSGAIDVRPEEDPSRWAEGYDERTISSGIVKGEFDIGLPAGMAGLVFNTRRPVFADQRVRQALIHLFDFEWINRSLYHGLYSRTGSYFERSMLASSGIPADQRERELLAPFLSEIKPEILSGEYRLPVSEGNGRNRENWRIALQLLNEAGYELEGGRLISTATGEQMTFEMLAATAAQERLFLSFARDLERLGIRARIRLVDSAQYQARLKTYDYDMIQTRWASSLSPGNEQLFRWSSAMADREGTFNYAGVKSPAVDAMIAAMLTTEALEPFVSSVRALDRALLSGDYVIPLYHLPKQWVAYWHHLGQPERTSLFGYQVDTWWSTTIGKAQTVAPSQDQ